MLYRSQFFSISVLVYVEIFGFLLGGGGLGDEGRGMGC